MPLARKWIDKTLQLTFAPVCSCLLLEAIITWQEGDSETALIKLDRALEQFPSHPGLRYHRDLFADQDADGSQILFPATAWDDGANPYELMNLDSTDG